MSAVDHAEVFFIDRRTGWASTIYDSEGNQLGGAVFSYLKKDAIREAFKLAGGAPVIIFSKQGKRMHVLYPKPTRL